MRSKEYVFLLVYILMVKKGMRRAGLFTLHGE